MSNLNLPRNEIARFCQRWKIREMALFGSVLRDDFSPDSDIDILVTFADDAKWGLLDLICPTLHRPAETRRGRSPLEAASLVSAARIPIGDRR